MSPTQYHSPARRSPAWSAVALGLLALPACDTAPPEPTLCFRAADDRWFLSCLAVSTDGRRAVAGLTPGAGEATLVVFDLDTGKEVCRCSGHRDVVLGAAFSPDGRRLASASKDRTVRVWDAVSGKELHCLKRHGSAVNAVAFTPDGRRLLSAGGELVSAPENSMRLWDAEKGTQVLHLDEGHLGAVTQVVMAPDGRTALSGSADTTVRLWDVGTGEELASLKGKHTGAIVALAIAPDGSRALSACKDGVVCLWELKDRKLSWSATLENALPAVGFSADGRQALGCAHRVVTEERPNPDEKGGRPLVVPVAWTFRVARWDAATGRELVGSSWRRSDDLRPWPGLEAAIFLPGGKRVLTGDLSRRVRAWEVPR
jgi:WD40 repeat protein